MRSRLRSRLPMSSDSAVPSPSRGGSSPASFIVREYTQAKRVAPEPSAFPSEARGGHVFQRARIRLPPLERSVAAIARQGLALFQLPLSWPPTGKRRRLRG